jgi:hypothetical protein
MDLPSLERVPEKDIVPVSCGGIALSVTVIVPLITWFSTASVIEKVGPIDVSCGRN